MKKKSFSYQINHWDHLRVELSPLRRRWYLVQRHLLSDSVAPHKTLPVAQEEGRQSGGWGGA